MQTIAIYGGSFDPPHVGHAMVCAWLTWTRQVDEVWLLPAAAHPFGKQSALFARRVAWCEALAQDLGGPVRVCTVESELPHPSYTIDTLCHLRATHPDRRFRLVIGGDVLQQVDRWKSWDRIAAEFSPLVVGRAGYPEPDGAVVFPEVSSTEIRERLAGGLSVDHLVTASVAALLQDQRQPDGDPPRT